MCFFKKKQKKKQTMPTESENSMIIELLCCAFVRNNGTAQNSIVMKFPYIFAFWIDRIITICDLWWMDNPVVHHNFLVNRQLRKRYRCQHSMDRRQLPYLHIHVQFADNDVNTNYDCAHTLVYISTLVFATAYISAHN